MPIARIQWRSYDSWVLTGSRVRWFNDMQLFTPNLPSEDTPHIDYNWLDTYKGWIQTPPPDIVEQEDDVTTGPVVDPLLKTLLASPSEGSQDEIGRMLPRQQSITPSASQQPRKHPQTRAKTDVSQSWKRIRYPYIYISPFWCPLILTI